MVENTDKIKPCPNYFSFWIKYNDKEYGITYDLDETNIRKLLCSNDPVLAITNTVVHVSRLASNRLIELLKIEQLMLKEVNPEKEIDPDVAD